MDNITAGFPDFWSPVHQKYKSFFDCAKLLEPIVSEMVKVPVSGPLLLTVRGLAAAAANSYGALLTLVLNGYGMDAMKIARSIYETELNILWLKHHPEDLEDFLDYEIIQKKQLYDQTSDEQQKVMPKEQYDAMIAEYERVLPRFASPPGGSRPRNEWCRVSLYKRAKEAEQRWKEEWAAQGITDHGISLYQTFYRHASSMHHMDIGGLVASVDSDMDIVFAPSWEHLDDALVAARSVLTCVSVYNDMASLDFGERINSGPNEARIRM